MQTVRKRDVRNRRENMRRLPRRTVRVECRRGYTGLGPNIATGFLDLSEGGMQLTLRVSLPTDQEVEILLTGAGMLKPIRRLANVCWALALENGETCVGLAFQKRLPYLFVQQFAKPM